MPGHSIGNMVGLPVMTSAEIFKAAPILPSQYSGRGFCACFGSGLCGTIHYSLAFIEDGPDRTIWGDEVGIDPSRDQEWPPPTWVGFGRRTIDVPVLVTTRVSPGLREQVRRLMRHSNTNRSPVRAARRKAGSRAAARVRAAV